MNKKEMLKKEIWGMPEVMAFTGKTRYQCKKLMKLDGCPIKKVEGVVYEKYQGPRDKFIDWIVSGEFAR